MDREFLDCQSFRRFGVEIELNTMDGVIKRCDESVGETPYGSEYIARIIRKNINQKVEIRGWDHVNNNNRWVIKPDMSCGIEVNSPILKGWRGLESLLRVIDAFDEDEKVNADEKCSLHIHVNVEDMNYNQIASIIAYYIKCEHIFLDLMPSCRKVNRYCQFLGMSDLFSHDFQCSSENLISRVSSVKYYSLNAYHMRKGRRKTIEFRIADNKCCTDSFFAKCWVRLLLHFVERMRYKRNPPNYEPGNRWSGLLWLEPKDVYSLLGFDQDLSDGMRQVRDWFMGRLLKNGYDTGLSGIWSNEGRRSVRKEVVEMCKGEKIEPLVASKELVYSKKYII